MINLNLKGRKPEELPDKETCDDILLELKDCGAFDIRWVNLNGGGFRANNRTFENLVERGQIAVYELDNSTLPKIGIGVDGQWLETINVSIKEKRYDILRHPIRISVTYKHNGDYQSNYTYGKFTEIHQLSDDVYQRLKDYIGPDIIQDQFLHTNFEIDFMVSSCKLIN